MVLGRAAAPDTNDAIDLGLDVPTMCATRSAGLHNVGKCFIHISRAEACQPNPVSISPRKRCSSITNSTTGKVNPFKTALVLEASRKPLIAGGREVFLRRGVVWALVVCGMVAVPRMHGSTNHFIYHHRTN